MTATLDRPATDSAPRDDVRRVWITGSIEAYKKPVLVDVHTVGEEVPGCVRVFCDYDSVARKNFRYIDAPLDLKPGAVEMDFNQLQDAERRWDGVAAFTEYGAAVDDLAARALLWAENDLHVARERLDLARTLLREHHGTSLVSGSGPGAMAAEEAGTAYQGVRVCLLPVDRALLALDAARWPFGVTL